MPTSIEDLKRKRFHSIMILAANLKKKSIPSVQSNTWTTSELSDATKSIWTSLSYTEKLAMDVVSSQSKLNISSSMNSFRTNQEIEPPAIYQCIDLNKIVNEDENADEEARHASKKFRRIIREHRTKNLKRQAPSEDEVRELDELVEMQRRRLPPQNEHILKKRRITHDELSNEDMEDLVIDDSQCRERYVYRGKKQ